MAEDQTVCNAEPRIAPLAEAELSAEALPLAARLRSLFGLETTELPDAVATMLRHPEIYRAQVDYITQRAKALTLEMRDLEVVILRTGWLCRSAYTWGEHVRFGRNAGLSAQEIEWLVQGSAAPGWNERDRALVRLAEELHADACVSDATWAVVAENFSDKQIIELLMMVGFYHEIAFLYNSMRVRLIPGNEGLAAR
ncbi:carboxymuconolactone decarboxylase family protein [Haliea sp. E17]|uniref:carboxymuconolactone decarboxylase family protein n=1 Tax=Haliea sp. E17 TaxID=3401576 RepID=UPI003AAD04B6